VQRVAAVNRLVAEGLTLSAAVGRVAAAGPRARVSGEADAFLLHQIMQVVPQGIWVWQGERTRYVNGRMGELIRREVADLMASPMLDFVESDDIERVRQRGWRVREGHRQHYETRLRRGDGTLLRADVDASPLWDAVGAYKGAVALISPSTPGGAG
jgi:PAS domain S-box-containing protein